MEKKLQKLAYEHTMAIERGLFERAKELSKKYDELEKVWISAKKDSSRKWAYGK